MRHWRLLRGNPDAADEILETRVGAPRVVAEGVFVEIHHHRFVLFVRLLQPMKYLIPVAQRTKPNRNPNGPLVSAVDLFDRLLQERQGFGLPPGICIALCKQRLPGGKPKLDGPPALGDCQISLAAPSVIPGEIDMREQEVWI